MAQDTRCFLTYKIDFPSSATYTDLINGDSFATTFTRTDNTIVPEGMIIVDASLNITSIKVYTSCSLSFGDLCETTQLRTQNTTNKTYTMKFDYISDQLLNFDNSPRIVTTTLNSSGTGHLMNIRRSYAVLTIACDYPPEENPEPEPDNPDNSYPEEPDSGYEDDDEGIEFFSFSPKSGTNIHFNTIKNGKSFTLTKKNIPSNAVLENFRICILVDRPEIWQYKFTSGGSYQPLPEDDFEFTTVSSIPSTIYLRTIETLQDKQMLTFQIDGSIDDEECMNYADYWLTYNTSEEFGDSTVWEFKTKGDYLAPDNFYNSGNGIFMRFHLPEGIPTENLSSINLTMNATLASEIPVYYYDDYFHKSTDEGPYISSIGHKATELTFKSTTNFKDFLDHGFHLGPGSLPEEGDILTIKFHGYVNGRYKADYGTSTHLITSMTDCTLPTHITINGSIATSNNSNTSVTYTADKLLLEWWGAQGGNNNPIAGYIIEYMDKDAEGNKGDYILYKNISTIQSSGSCYIPTPNCFNSRKFRIKTYGKAGENNFTSPYKETYYIYRPEIQSLIPPSGVCLESAITNSTTNLIFNPAQNNINNNIIGYEIQYAKTNENNEWDPWRPLTTTSLATFPNYEYTGDHEIYYNNYGQPILRLKTSGTLTFKQGFQGQVFLVGGGGSGSCLSNSYYYGAGGGSGYTIMIDQLTFIPEQNYPIVIGEGGIETRIRDQVGSPGGTTSAFGHQAHGGMCAINKEGGYGGSGGGTGSNGSISYNSPTDGGIDGSNGIDGIYKTSADDTGILIRGGFGQGCTTRAFMDPEGELYAKGGTGYMKTGNIAPADFKPANNTGNGGVGGGGAGATGVVLIRQGKGQEKIEVNPPDNIDQKYMYRIRAMGDAGEEFYSTWVICEDRLSRNLLRENYTDNPIIAKETPIKAKHITEIQNDLNNWLSTYRGISYNFTPILAGQTLLKDWKSHLLELQEAYELLNKNIENWQEIEEGKPKASIFNNLRDIISQGYKIRLDLWNDDNLLETKYISYGAKAEVDLIPKREEEEEVTFQFRGWSTTLDGVDPMALNSITHPKTLYSEYISIPKRLEVIYKSCGEELFRTSVPYGSWANYLGDTPVNTANSVPTDFKFDGWDGDTTYITKNTTFNALFSSAHLTDTIKDSWEEIATAVEDGSYINKYKTGDTKQLYLGEQLGFINMVIAAVDYDTDSSGDKTHLTWISEQLLPTPQESGATSWEESQIRQYLENTVFNCLPIVLQDKILSTKKVTSDSVTYDKLWTLSRTEISGNTIRYYPFLSNNADSRVKTTLKNTNKQKWWLRENSTIVTTTGAISNLSLGTSGTSEAYILFGFCI